MDRYHMFIALFLALFLRLVTAEAIDLAETCEDSLKNTYQIPYDHNSYLRSTTYWSNLTTWDGYMKIPQKDELAPECLFSSGNVIVLTEKHPDIESISEDIVEIQACSLNEDRLCEGIINVLLRKCNGSLLYNFKMFYDTNIVETYLCSERIYTDIPCRDSIKLQLNKNRFHNILNFTLNGHDGWTETFVDGRQFVIPSLDDDIEIIFEACASKGPGAYFWQYFLQDPLPNDIGEAPKRLVACYVYRFYRSIGDYKVGKMGCNGIVYVRSCNGKLQFDLSWNFNVEWYICLIYHSNIKVQPKIEHEVNVIIEGDKEEVLYTPVLTYRCSFDMIDDTQYKANWYVNGTFQIHMGPSSNLDDLILTEAYLTDLTDGYELHCGVFRAHENETMETLSDAYYAGWKISNKDILLSKSGVVTVSVEQTIPVGCSYMAGYTDNCLETLAFDDILQSTGVCAGGIKVRNSDDPRKSFIEIKSLKKGEEWKNQKYSLQLSTIDSDYDDKSTFDLQMKLAYKSNENIGKAVTSKTIGAVHVEITNINRHWSKRCYSHVDPHMKTVDGVHYEAQREGDYMLFMNDKYQTEIQTSARYCSPGYTSGPVCACGIAVAVGADLFIINRCHDQPFIFDLICGDGGIIDIERVHDYKYLVRTPIGTIIEILFVWGNLMNIDVYMSPNDFGNVEGLCGNFDGDSSNDLEHRDGTFSYDDNKSYKFADSWRLTDEENLFKHPNRKLDHWDENNAGDSDSSCERVNSITRNKCKIKKRHRRSNCEHEQIRLKNRHNIFFSRQKRSDISLNEEEAFQLCNNTIYSTPAVQDFSDKLAEEDPEVVVEQCVYDLTQGNDTTWIDAHVSALNSAADTILRLNPVFVANNTDKVNAFRSETCLNNCSGNGICTNSGLCECSGPFRGPDCSIDIRVPPVIYEIECDGVCTITDEDDCTCFQIRTDNIFDGFVCNISENKVYFNGTRMEGSTYAELGLYEDIFTGECCVSAGISNSSTVSENSTDELFVISYEFSISNDGVNYGETNSVYVFDTECIQQVDIDDTVTFMVKDKYCFIDGKCVAQNVEVLDSSACFLCDPAADLYNWTKGKCEGSGNSLGTGAIVGIVLGSVVLIVIIAVLVYILTCKKSNSHSVGVLPKSDGVQPHTTTPRKGMFSCDTNNEKIVTDNLVTTLESRCFSPAKPRFQQNVWIGTTHQIGGDMKTGEVKHESSTRTSDACNTQIDNLDKGKDEQNAGRSENGKPKRDISFIKLELD